MIRIAPSLLSADFSNLREEMAKVEGADFLHLDVMDGHFVPNLTFGPPVVASLRPHSPLPFDVHLMVTNPDSLFGAWKKAGADWITVHVEACTHLHRTISAIHELGMKAGVSLNPHTSLADLEYVLPDLDLVLLMSVNPGFGGQSFITEVLRKIRRLRQMIDERGLPTLISVDGGVDLTTAPLVAEAGADVLVAGTAVFKAPDVPGAVRVLREVATAARTAR